jgi:hypothetical protein
MMQVHVLDVYWTLVVRVYATMVVRLYMSTGHQGVDSRMTIGAAQ